MPIIYDAVNTEVLNSIPKTAMRILDLGCGAGTLGAVLKQRQKCEVHGVTFSEEEATLARLKLDNVLVANLNSFDPASLGEFDVAICSHVLEHLYEPQRLLTAMKPSLSQKGK